MAISLECRLHSVVDWVLGWVSVVHICTYELVVLMRMLMPKSAFNPPELDRYLRVPNLGISVACTTVKLFVMELFGRSVRCYQLFLAFYLF